MTKKGSRSQLKILFNQQHFSGAKIRLPDYAATFLCQQANSFALFLNSLEKNKD